MTTVPGEKWGDAYNYVWSSWWFEKAVFILDQSPAEMDLIYFPIGAFHPKEIASLYAKLVAVPLIHYFRADPFIVYNLHLFAASILTMFFMAWLCFELTGSRAAALIGGIIFTFSANRTSHLLAGHFTQSLTYFYPLLVLAILRMWQNPTLFGWLLFGIILALATLVDLVPLAFFIGPVLISMLLFLLLTDRRRFLSKPFLRSLVPGLMLAIFLVVPFFYPMISSAAEGKLNWYEGAGVVEFSADALAFIIPTPDHSLVRLWPALKNISDQIYTFGVSRFEGTVYLGWIAILLALIGIIKCWEQKSEIKYWMTVAFAAVVLALGPWLRVGGRIVGYPDQPLLMPYAALLYLPFMSWGRTPGRFGLTAIFAVAILSAFGAAWLFGHLRGKFSKVMLTGGLAALILFESLTAYPWPFNDRRVPEFYQGVAADERRVAFLDLPVMGYVPAKYYMLYQMVHGHAIVGGWRDRRSHEVEDIMAEFEVLAEPGGDIEALAEAGIGYIVLHKQFLAVERLGWLKDHLNNEIGAAIYEDDSIVAYKLLDVDEVAPKPVASE